MATATKCRTHQYKRITQPPSNREIYRCMNCSHYVTPEFLQGRQSICWDCKEEFTIDRYAAERKFPKCVNCRDRVTNFTKTPEDTLGPSPADIGPKENDLPPSSDNVVADILKRYGL